MSACEKTLQVYRGSGACSLREISYSEIAFEATFRPKQPL